MWPGNLLGVWNRRRRLHSMPWMFERFRCLRERIIESKLIAGSTGETETEVNLKGETSNGEYCKTGY
jgi:hypothetical protein